MKTKKGAFELSITTVVVIVIAIVLLVLGLVLVRTIFRGAQENVETINERVKGEIDKLFTEEDQKVAIFLSGRKATVKQGESFGVAFAIKNINPTSETFSYSTSVSDKGNCPLSEEEIESWVLLGKREIGIALNSGGRYYALIRLAPPRTAPLCMPRFSVRVEQGGEPYESFFFDVEVSS